MRVAPVHGLGSNGPAPAANKGDNNNFLPCNAWIKAYGKE